MEALQRNRRRGALALSVAAGLLLTLGASGVSANSVPHPDLRLNLFNPPATLPADAPFWAAGGFATDSGAGELPAAATPGSAVFELTVDGELVALRKDVEYRGGNSVESVAILWYRNFDDGLPAGEHHFDGRWYVDDGLILQLEADVLFE